MTSSRLQVCVTSIGTVKYSPWPYVLVSQTTYCVEVFERNVDFWKYRLIEGIDPIVDLAQLDMVLSVKEIYEGITLKPS